MQEMNALSEEEKNLFAAIKSKSTDDVRDIIRKEEAARKNGEAPRIRAVIQDENADTICHAAARTGVRDLIECVLFSTINFVHNVRNKQDKLPEDVDWGYCFFSKNLVDRKKRDVWEFENQKLLDSHQLAVAKMVQDESNIGGYGAGIIFTQNFTLIYGSKHAAKVCYIEDRSSFNGQSIHDRAALDEAIVANQYEAARGAALSTPANLYKPAWSEYPPQLQAENYIIANIGFVMGIESHVPQKIQRRFFSVPIYIDDVVKTQAKLPFHRATSGHSDANLYDVLLIEENLKSLLQYFRNMFKIKSGDVRKLYACILDFHSSQDVCDGCESATYKFEVTFPQVLKAVAKECDFILSPSHFRVVIRASSSREPTHSDYRKEPHRRKTLNTPFYQTYLAREHTHHQPLDLKKSQIFMLHSDTKARKAHGSDWYTKSKIFSNQFDNIPPRTLFFVTRNSVCYRNPNFPNKYAIKEEGELLNFLKK
ncbi:MAG: hypothetical protein SFW07_06710 [Gammaproteobacteria bacterium]|nr:hypothetical protein [Gammaproteobacteria bacterium]